MNTKLFYYLFFVLLFATSCSNNSDSITKTDSIINVENITLNKKQLTLQKGNKEILVATISPSNASNEQIVWHSENSSIASVTTNGEVVAKKVGQTVISAKTPDNKHEANCLVNVYTGIEKIKFNSYDITIRKGEVKQLDFDVIPSDATENICWESSNTNILTVDGTGKITGISTGQVSVYVFNEDKTIIDTCNVKVVVPPNAYNGYECVDLGLPSGTLWAKYNIGASSEAEVGTYFYWGEVSDNETGQSIFYISENKYTDEQGFEHCIPAHYDELGDIQGTQYDAAHTIMGENWMIPEKSDMDELLKNTTHEEVEKEGRKGLKFTGKNGNYIFIPAAGALTPRGYCKENNIRCCITIATSTNEKKYAGYWGYTMSKTMGTVTFCEERSFRHQVRGIVKQWY